MNTEGPTISVAIGDYAKTPTGRTVQILRSADEHFVCIYLDSPGDQVVLHAKHLVKVRKPAW